MKSYFNTVGGNRYFYSSKWRSFHYKMEKEQYVDLGLDEPFEEYEKKRDFYFTILR